MGKEQQRREAARRRAQYAVLGKGLVVIAALIAAGLVTLLLMRG